MFDQRKNQINNPANNQPPNQPAEPALPRPPKPIEIKSALSEGKLSAKSPQESPAGPEDILA